MSNQPNLKIQYDMVLDSIIGKIYMLVNQVDDIV